MKCLTRIYTDKLSHIHNVGRRRCLVNAVRNGLVALTSRPGAGISDVKLCSDTTSECSAMYVARQCYSKNFRVHSLRCWNSLLTCSHWHRLSLLLVVVTFLFVYYYYYYYYQTVGLLSECIMLRACVAKYAKLSYCVWCTWPHKLSLHILILYDSIFVFVVWWLAYFCLERILTFFLVFYPLFCTDVSAPYTVVRRDCDFSWYLRVFLVFKRFYYFYTTFMKTFIVYTRTFFIISK